MSEIITAYPTSGLANRTASKLITSFSDYIKSIKEVTDFFTSIDLTTNTTWSANCLKFVKGSSYIGLHYVTHACDYAFTTQSTSTTDGAISNRTSATSGVDIPIHHATGINGTTALWLDDFSKGACMVFGKFDDKYFIANSSADTNYACYYSDTGNTVKNLPVVFNGSNIGTGGDYIAQPYYHNGINTSDIYTFDGGSADIPWGKFKLSNAEFVRLFSNFALRIK